MWFRKPKVSPAEAASALRAQTFSLSAAEVGLSPGPGHMNAWAVLMETGFAGAVASLVCVADGTTSMYLRTAEGSAEDLAKPTHALALIFRAGHQVITAIRESGKFQ